MKTVLTSGALAAALFAAAGSALETAYNQITANFAQAEVEHRITIINGVLEPCRDSVSNELIACPKGQFIWRDEFDGNLDCPCRYEL